MPDHQDAIAKLLDDFHDAASRADAGTYFSCFSPDAVFLGTDASERWTVPEFKAYALPHFEKGNGWTYVPKQRHVMVGADRRTAWFDELLENEKYGICRGTGVAVRDGVVWRIAHYSLTFAIPNESAEAVMDAVRRTEDVSGGS